ncbi:MAG: FapA family protein [Dehalococcoidia bacterium]
MTPAPTDDLDGRWEISFDGLTVGLVVYPPKKGGAPVPLDAVQEALKRQPIDTYVASRVETAVKDKRGTPVPVAEIELPDDADGACFIRVSPDRMAAYLIPVPQPETLQPETTPALENAGIAPEAPPPPDPPTVTADDIRDQLSQLGIRAGVQEQVLADFAEPTVLTEVLCIARGRLPTQGQDAQIEFAFETDPRAVLTEGADGRVDYHSILGECFVDPGDLLATRRPPVEGKPGIDVYGEIIPPEAPRDRDLETLTGSGVEAKDEQLFAKRSGRPVLHEGRVNVIPVYEVDHDLDYSVGNLRFPGDIIIRGDVKPGFEIKADGSVVVDGVSEGSSITATHDITLGGVVGQGDTTLRAGGSVIAKFIHSANIEADDTVKVANEILNCTISARRVETSFRGRVVGGEITVIEELDTGTLGSAEGVRTYIRVVPDDLRASPVVRARDKTCPGVTIQIKAGILNVQDVLPAASFWEVNTAIVKLKPGADEAAGEQESTAA